MSSYLSSRGWRNNNPLNIRRGEKWQGLCEEQTDREFCQFLTMSFGYRAAAKCLKSYSRYFRQTGKEWNITNIITRWCPDHTAPDYIRRVLQIMGREPDFVQLADMQTRPGRYQLALLVAAMTCVECGCPPSAVLWPSINTGFILAGLGDPNITSDWWK